MHCDRGHRYCSPGCRGRARLEQRRAAGRRHQQSLEGRLDHRDRQRAYRLRKAAKLREAVKQSVTDDGSQAGMTSANILPPCRWPPELDGSGWRRHLWQIISSFGLVICHFCGRVGRFLNPFK